MFRKLLTFSYLVANSLAFPFYADQIPNGRSVPNPGPQGGVWAGVGHINAGGGGPRNDFGLDFKDQNFLWTIDLCMMDSDGDGRSNGEELGDPNCTWSFGSEPEGPAISHPGIVDTPSTSIGNGQDPCEFYSDPADVEVMEIKFSQVNNMDATRTHYVCEQMQVDAPSDESQYHQVKTEILLDNSDVLHHIWIYLCEDTESTDGDKVGQGPYSCSGMEGNCFIVAGWAVGKKEWCEPPHVGALLDFGSNKKTIMKIEAHYDNGTGQPQSDRGGMKLFLTPTLRPLDASLAILGMDYWDRQFRIPAGQENYAISNICPSAATEYLPRPVYVYSWNPHMHLYGKSLVTEHYRCGEKIGEIGRIEEYEFDNQQSYYLEEPIKILPGDALVTTCTFDTTKATSDVLGGEQTTEEMCDNYLTYYPWAGTEWYPELFTACSAFNEGTNPQFSGFDDPTPFVSFDLSGDILIWNWEEDPTKNIPSCCASNTCESYYLADANEPCGVDEDCVGDLVCLTGVCETKSLFGTTATQIPKQADGNHHHPPNSPHHAGPLSDDKSASTQSENTPSAGVVSNQFHFMSTSALMLFVSLVYVLM